LKGRTYQTIVRRVRRRMACGPERVVFVGRCAVMEVRVLYGCDDGEPCFEGEVGGVWGGEKFRGLRINCVSILIEKKKRGLR
jgi:hypothetical protein